MEPSLFCERWSGWNSPYINHFISPDAIVWHPFNPQDLNRYSYVLNNPLRYTDPTGHYACGDGEEHDCDGHKQDPEQNPHPPQPPKPDDDKDDDILSPNKDDDVTLPIPTLTPATGTQSSSGPNYGQIAAGIGIILAVDLLIVAPIVVGVALTSPEIEVFMVLDISWEVAFVSAVVAANIYGWNLILDGLEESK